jgi:hypothetical protein
MKAAGFEATPAEEMDFVKDMPTDDEKIILIGLLNQSDLNESEYELAKDAINSCTDYKTYQRISYRLESRQRPIDQIQNPSQKDINNHLKKTIK